MPKGPKGEKRPGDVIGAAVMVAKIATGEVEEKREKFLTKNQAASIGGKARAEKLSAAQRKQIAEKAASKRWGTTQVVRDEKEHS